MRADEATESVVVTKAVRLVVPHVAAFGLYTMFHGASSVGGGFQGGVVVAAAVVTIAFGFGIDQTRRWLHRPLAVVFAVAGVLVIALVGLVPALGGGTFLEFAAVPGPKGPLYAVELVELAVGLSVAATIVVLVLVTAAEGEPG